MGGERTYIERRRGGGRGRAVYFLSHNEFHISFSPSFPSPSSSIDLLLPSSIDLSFSLALTTHENERMYEKAISTKNNENHSEKQVQK